jgi:hypothetical protein
MLTEGNVTPAEEFLTRYLMEDPELLAIVGDDIYKKGTIPRGNSGYTQPILPGEQRLIPRMQEPRMQEQLPMRPSLPPYV